MIRVTNINEKYIPIARRGRGVTIAFDYEPMRDSDKVGTWTVHTFDSVPSFTQIQTFITSAINKRTDELILSGFTWNGMQVWLSSENQFNYKAAYDLAVQTNGANLPTVFKFGDNANPVYHKFDTVEELSDFYIKAMSYINNCLAIGWAKKDAIDWEQYKLQE